MQLRIYKKINIEALLKLIILIGFAFSFSYMIMTDKILLYVHPRIVPYVKFAIVAMLLLSLSIVRDIFKPKRRVNITPYLFFIIPLFMAFILPQTSPDSTSMSFGDSTSNNQVVNKADSTTSNNNIIDQGKTKSDNTGTNATASSNINKKSFGLEMRGDTIVISTDNFVKWINEIYENTEKYEGKKIELTGFVFKYKDFRKNEFSPARLMMACCSADLQPIGLLCRYDKTAELKQDTWISVIGKIKIEDYKGQKTPIIIAENIQNIEKPKNNYVYPY
ncbi:putative membrane protein [Clostridium cavendishii DSM 21758]|uniref:Putative membrane protein n=1 Tax=Clostridium cavendishii DSM 21758 TaxID=1121302 RepID=A0A1M6KXR8_9CLOT|nr:TIGR03943 family protein [Clostridium cavendishii]SHJ63768.1 putative membrane protein [Clostridium cavendishii DSM 21758]